MVKAQKEYKVIPVGEKWCIVRSSDEHPRPIGEKLYDHRTHAYRRCRKLNKDAQAIDEMIKRDGAIII